MAVCWQVEARNPLPISSTRSTGPIGRSGRTKLEIESSGRSPSLLRELPAGEFVARSLPWVVADLGRQLDADELAVFSEIAPLVQERTKLLKEVAPQVLFLFADITYDETSWRKVMTKQEVPVVLAAAEAALSGLGEWSTETIEEALRGMLDEQELSPRKGLQPLRVAISGSSISPPLFESMDVLGKDRTLERIGAAAAQLAE